MRRDLSLGDPVVYPLLAGAEAAPDAGPSGEGAAMGPRVDAEPRVAPVLERRRVRADGPGLRAVQRVPRTVRRRQETGRRQLMGYAPAETKALATHLQRHRVQSKPRHKFRLA